MTLSHQFTELSKFRIRIPLKLSLMTKTLLIGSEPSKLHVGLPLFSFTASNSRSKNRQYSKPTRDRHLGVMDSCIYEISYI